MPPSRMRRRKQVACLKTIKARSRDRVFLLGVIQRNLSAPSRRTPRPIATNARGWIGCGHTGCATQTSVVMDPGSALATLACPGRHEETDLANSIPRSSLRKQGPIATNACCSIGCGRRGVQHRHRCLWVPAQRSLRSLGRDDGKSSIVIPGRAQREPGIHNPQSWLWIPGLRQGAHPGMTTVACYLLWHVIARSDLSAVAQRAKAVATKRSSFIAIWDMDCFAEPVIGRAFARSVGSQ
jgi:hypothetical protein